MAAGSHSGLGLGRSPLGASQAGLVFSFDTGRRGLCRFAFKLGTPPCFACLLLLGRDAGQGRRLGGLLSAEPTARQFRRTPFDFGALAGQTGQLLLPGGTRGGCACKLRGGKLAALGIGQRALLRLDLRAQRDLGEAFDMRLLRGGSLCGSLCSGTPDGLLGGEFVGLQASLRCNYLFGRLQFS